jgi:hypothetical protein
MFLNGPGAFALVDFHGASSLDIKESLVLPRSGLGIGLRDGCDKSRRQADEDNAQPKPEEYLKKEATHGPYLPLVSIGVASR